MLALMMDIVNNDYRTCAEVLVSLVSDVFNV